jgi:hypothetical protein
MMEVKWQAQFEGMTVNREGDTKLKLLVVNLETAKMLPLVQKWTKQVSFAFETKNKVEAVMTVEHFNFRRDGTTVLTLTSHSKELGGDLAVFPRMRGKNIDVAASW